MHILLTLLAAFFSIPVTGSHLYKRAYTYQCADLTGVALYVTVDGSPYYAGDIQTCGCASEQWVSEEIENSGDDAIYNAEQAAGLDATVTAVSNLVFAAASEATCNYPDHAIDSCRPTSVCNFLCTDGYVKSGTTCICRSPKTVCNGLCSSTCSTTGMRKRNIKPRSKCPADLTVCGVRTVKRSEPAYECVDTQYDPESCGGCKFPLPHQLLLPNQLASPRGKDCTAIKGAKTTFCDSGVCKVIKCQSGYTLRDGRSCIKHKTAPPEDSQDVFFGPWMA